MSRADLGWTDERLDALLGNLLRFGVLTAALVVLAGGALYLYQHGRAVPDYREYGAQAPPPRYDEFRGVPRELRSVPGIVSVAGAFRSRGVIQLGILLLIATPIARVIFSVFAFTMQRDWLYLSVTLVVLAVLLFSLLAG